MTTKHRPRVYVAGPISTGDVTANVMRAVHIGRSFIDIGLAPLIPHLDYYLPDREDISWKEWLEVDLPWLRVADAVLRISGESKGADREVRVARRNDIEVYHSVTDLCEALGYTHRLTEGIRQEVARWE